MAQEMMIKTIKSYLLICYMVLFLINTFYPKELWTIIMAPLIIVIIMITFPFAKPFNKYLSSILFVVGLYIFVKHDAQFDTYVGALVKNGGLITLLVSLPLLATILYYENFELHISNVTRKYIHSSFSFYAVTNIIVTFFGMLLNVASMPMVYHLLEKTIKKYPKKFFYKALTRGFGLNMLWSPSFLSVAAVLQYMNMTWHEIAPICILLALVGNILSLILGKIAVKNEVFNEDDEVSNILEEPEIRIENTKESYRSSFRILIMILLLIFVIIALESLTKKSAVSIVPVVAIIFPIFLAVLFRKLDVFKRKAHDYVNISLFKMNDEMILFTSIGFFGHALTLSDSTKYITLIINRLGIDSPLALIPFLVFIITALGIAGIHPLITMSTIAIIFSGGTLPLTQLQLAATLLIGYFSYTLLSPFSGAMLVVSSIEQKNPLDISTKLNWIYITLFTAVATIVLFFVG